MRSSHTGLFEGFAGDRGWLLSGWVADLAGGGFVTPTSGRAAAATGSRVEEEAKAGRDVVDDEGPSADTVCEREGCVLGAIDLEGPGSDATDGELSMNRLRSYFAEIPSLNIPFSI